MAWNRHDEGKIIDHFRFRAGKKEYNLPVRIIKTSERKDHRYAPKPETIRVEFGIAIPNGKGGIVKTLRGTDIEILRAGARKELGDLHAIEWDDYYLIEVEEKRDRYYNNSIGGDGLEFWYKIIQIGKLEDGTVVHRQDRWSDTDDYQRGWPKTGRARGSIISVVKKTAKAEVALKEFERRLRLFRESVAKFLGPKRVEETLSKAAELSRMLPAPAKEKKRARKRT